MIAGVDDLMHSALSVRTDVFQDGCTGLAAGTPAGRGKLIICPEREMVGKTRLLSCQEIDGKHAPFTNGSQGVLGALQAPRPHWRGEGPRHDSADRESNRLVVTVDSGDDSDAGRKASENALQNRCVRGLWNPGNLLQNRHGDTAPSSNCILHSELYFW